MRWWSATWFLAQQRPLCLERPRRWRRSSCLELARKRLFDLCVLVELCFRRRASSSRSSTRRIRSPRRHPLPAIRKLVERLARAPLRCAASSGKRCHQVAVATHRVTPGGGLQLVRELLLLLCRLFVGGRGVGGMIRFREAVGVELALLLVGALRNRAIGVTFLPIHLALDGSRAVPSRKARAACGSADRPRAASSSGQTCFPKRASLRRRSAAGRRQRHRRGRRAAGRSMGNRGDSIKGDGVATGITGMP